MPEAETTSNPGRPGDPARIRTAGEGSPGGPPARPRGSAQRRAVRPGRGRSAGAGARLLAPLALIVCVIAVFSVLTSGDSDTVKRGSSDTQESTSAESSGGDADTGSDGDGATSVPTRSTYRVKPGDSFAAIAEKTGVDVDKLAELNPDVDPRALQPGQKLKLK